MTRDEYLKLAERYISLANDEFDGEGGLMLARATLAQAALMMAEAMDPGKRNGAAQVAQAIRAQTAMQAIMK